MGLDFVAVDFETANADLTSACAMGLAFVRNGRLGESTSFLIRPPTSEFTFSHLHGLKWEGVRDAPTFCDLWENLRERLRSEILVAHNADFDRSVLSACLNHYGISHQINPFLCSMQIAKKAFRLRRLKLDYVCKQLKIELLHHNAESDARAAANIVIMAAPRLRANSTEQLLKMCRIWNGSPGARFN